MSLFSKLREYGMRPVCAEEPKRAQDPFIEGVGYCPACGKRNVKRWTGKYSIEDGSKILVDRCADACLINHYFTPNSCIAKSMGDSCFFCGKYVPWSD